MLHTYKAILRGNRLEWSDAPPADLAPERPIAVHVTILDEANHPPESAQAGHQMAAILEQLAQIHAFTDLADPAAWERDIRSDRILPEREG
jgi:hypothetical protein